MKTTFNSQKPLTPKQRVHFQRAKEIKQQVESVKSLVLSGPSDSFEETTDDHGIRFGSREFKGKIGDEEFTRAITGREGSHPDGKLKGFVAHNDDQRIQWIALRSEATGLRAGLAGMVGGLAGAIAGAGTSLMASVMKSPPQSMLGEVGSSLKLGAANSLIFLSNITGVGERALQFTGESDNYYHVENDGLSEKVRFRTNGIVEYESFESK